MMNNFIFSQEAPEMTFHNETMLKNISATIGIRMIRTAYLYIAVAMITFAAFPIPMFITCHVSIYALIPWNSSRFEAGPFLRMFLKPLSITNLATKALLSLEQNPITNLTMPLFFRRIIARTATKSLLSFEERLAALFTVFLWITLGFPITLIATKALLSLSQGGIANFT